MAGFAWVYSTPTATSTSRAKITLASSADKRSKKFCSDGGPENGAQIRHGDSSQDYPLPIDRWG